MTTRSSSPSLRYHHSAHVRALGSNRDIIINAVTAPITVNKSLTVAG